MNYKLIDKENSTRKVTDEIGIVFKIYISEIFEMFGKVPEQELNDLKAISLIESRGNMIQAFMNNLEFIDTEFINTYDCILYGSNDEVNALEKALEEAKNNE